MDILAEIRALWHEVLDMKYRTTQAGGGVHAREHGPGHQSGGDDELDITDLGGFPGGTTDFLRADGTFATPPGGVSDGDKGDISVSGSGSVWTIDDNVVTYAKMQDVSATARILARKTAGAGDAEEATLSEVLDFIGSAAQGDILYRGSGGWARLAAGTSGHFLKTLGAGADPQWASAGGGGGGSVGDLLDWQFVRKTSDESVTSSTTLQADDELLFAIGANETWEFEFVLNHIGNETGDLKVSVSGPTDCAGQWAPIGPHGSSTGASRIFNARSFTTWDQSESHAFGNISTVRTSSLIKGLARNGANAGNIALNWAQDVSNGTATQVLTDSYIVARRVG